MRAPKNKEQQHVEIVVPKIEIVQIKIGNLYFEIIIFEVKIVETEILNQNLKSSF